VSSPARDWLSLEPESGQMMKLNDQTKAFSRHYEMISKKRKAIANASKNEGNNALFQRLYVRQSIDFRPARLYLFPRVADFSLNFARTNFLCAPTSGDAALYCDLSRTKSRFRIGNQWYHCCQYNIILAN
jgi:hypothetical protein